MLHPNVTNPVLMNEYQAVFSESSQVVDFQSPFAGHVHLPKANKEDFLSGFFYSNPESALGLAARTLKGENVLSKSMLKKLMIPSR